MLSRTAVRQRKMIISERLRSGLLISAKNGWNPSPLWRFWDETWGNKHDALNEEPYFSARKVLRSNVPMVKPDEAGWNAFSVQSDLWTAQFNDQQMDVRFAGRMTPDSAIPVESTRALCAGRSAGTNYFESPRNAMGGARSAGVERHHMQWIFLPPDGTPANCKYCGMYFKRASGWTGGFDSNLLPTTGYHPTEGCIDPCLVGKKNAEPVANAVKL